MTPSADRVADRDKDIRRPDRDPTVSAPVSHFSFLQQQLKQGDLAGHDGAWPAPVAIFESPEGFGESVWQDAAPASFLSVTLAGSSVRKVCGPRPGQSSHNQTCALVPKGSPTPYIADGAIQWAVIYLPDALLGRVSADGGISGFVNGLRDDIVFPADRALEERALDYVRRARNQVDRPSALEMEARSLLLLDQLASLHSHPTQKSFVSGGLAPRHLRRVVDYIEAHVGRDISLSELAALTELSAKHFARAFKQSTGLPPHQWLIALRIKRAQHLLTTTDATIAEIALSCGFADQSHFTAAFRKATSSTPAAFRRAYSA
jgi:AraC family transcriptional regulator